MEEKRFGSTYEGLKRSSGCPAPGGAGQFWQYL